mmetsp:Transcript_3887/g.9228  ORF Transcript_3887/g.9228 Transcript_3887/m.9228 type:complete len:204 (-) Transcript_3887:10-621(-)
MRIFTDSCESNEKQSLSVSIPYTIHREWMEGLVDTLDQALDGIARACGQHAGLRGWIDGLPTCRDGFAASTATIHFPPCPKLHRQARRAPSSGFFVALICYASLRRVQPHSCPTAHHACFHPLQSFLDHLNLVLDNSLLLFRVLCEQQCIERRFQMREPLSQLLPLTVSLHPLHLPLPHAASSHTLEALNPRLVLKHLLKRCP